MPSPDASSGVPGDVTVVQYAVTVVQYALGPSFMSAILSFMNRATCTGGYNAKKTG
jgi:hypothetical protein